MKRHKTTIHYLMFFFLLLICLSACQSSVRKEQSKFGGSSVEMDDILISDAMAKPRVNLQLHWDESIVKNKSLAKIEVNQAYEIAKDSFLNIYVDGKKYKIDLMDSKKMSNVESKVNYVGPSIVRTDTVNYTTVFYLVPDNILNEIAQARDVTFRINFAHGNKFENDISDLVKRFIGRFNKVKASQ